MTAFPYLDEFIISYIFVTSLHRACLDILILIAVHVPFLLFMHFVFPHFMIVMFSPQTKKEMPGCLGISFLVFVRYFFRRCSITLL
nr:MAG TPA: hypothetical protein [Caudoviricetes sp.]